MNKKDRLLDVFERLRYEKVLSTKKEFAERIGFDKTNLSSAFGGSEKYLTDNLFNKIADAFPQFDRVWLLTGEGEMLKNSIQDISTDRQEVTLVPLLPVSAQGGRINDFVVSVRKEDCEKLISPIKGADFAIMISGDSMAPEYPSGSKVLVKKINSKSFIEWGRCYLLDTCNGSIVKKLSPPVENDEVFGKDYFTCVSVNPDPLYSPFRVPTCDVYGIYRVMMLLSEK